MFSGPSLMPMKSSLGEKRMFQLLPLHCPKLAFGVPVIRVAY
jgi:hypothetical protein